MLREIPANVLPARDGAACSDSTKARSVVMAASARQLPSSDSEEDLEDYSSSDNDGKPAGAPALSVPRSNLRRLVRLGDGARNGANQQKDALADDVLDSFATLQLGSRASPASAVNEPQPGGCNSKAAPAAAPVTDNSPACAPVAHNEDDVSGSDEEYEPFFERQAPRVEPKPSAASALPATTPDPGSLVLGQRQQYVVPAPVSKKLYPHQVQGVKWLWSLFEMQRGGILGDDMGLGKTMQCSAFLAGLFNSGLMRRAIIIAPKTLLPHWLKELAVCGLKGLTREFFGSSEAERTSALRNVVRGRGIIVTTYGMVQHNADQLAGPTYSSHGDDFSWDVMLLDEGHKIKNPKMKLVEQLRKLPAGVRIIISGTPIQNNLMEMHSLFDFTTEGLLGDAKTFKKNYERPVTIGLDKEASARERQTGAAIAAELRQRVEPFFLRREKKDVLREADSNSSGDASGSGAGGGSAGGAGTSSADGAQPVGQRAQTLPRKNDLVVWLRLKPLQRKIYTSFLHTDSVKEVLNEKASPLAAITVLKKICDHPALLTQRTANSVITGAHRWANHGKGERQAGRKGGSRRDSLDDFIVDDDESDEESEEEISDSGSEKGPASEDNSAEDAPIEWLGDGASLAGELARELERRGADASCKSAFVLTLLERLHAEGHRTLIFSQSKVMLSILEAGVKAMKLTYCRIDGDVSSAEERQAHVQRFQTSKDIPVFLLTSQVGGLGLTLTAADRVIIVDPAWNPSVDNQSVDRAYRLGQTKDVVVYRLITCGTVEEKIYRKQVFKGGLMKTGTEEGIQFRYFTQTDLRDLFTVTAEGLQQSVTQVQLNGMHAHQRTATEALQRHLEHVLRMEGVAGIHDHNLLFTQRPQEHVPTAQEGAAILSQMTRAGPIGVDALTNMLGSGLNLSSGAVNTKHKAAVDQARRKIEELATRIRTTQGTLSAALAMRMPDGGAKLKESLAVLERQYLDATAALEALEAENRSGNGSGTSARPSEIAGGTMASREAANNSAAGASAGAGAGGSTGRSGALPDAPIDRNLVATFSRAAASGQEGPAQSQLPRPPGRLGGLGFGAGLMARAAAANRSTSNTSSSTGPDVAASGSVGPHPSVDVQRPAGGAGAGQRDVGGGPRTREAPAPAVSAATVSDDDEEEHSFFSVHSEADRDASDDAASRPVSSPIDLTGSPGN